MFKKKETKKAEVKTEVKEIKKDAPKVAPKVVEKAPVEPVALDRHGKPKKKVHARGRY